MLHILDNDGVAETAYHCFSVLDRGYFEDQWKEFVKAMYEIHDDLYETRFIIVDRQSGKPVSVNAIVRDRKTAEELLPVFGEDKHEVALLLLDA